MTTNLIKKVFIIAGISLASITAYSLVTGDAFNQVVFKAAQETYRTTWTDRTYGNGTAINSSVEDNWEKLKGTKGSVISDGTQDYANRGTKAD